jgi:hypothetical protein
MDGGLRQVLSDLCRQTDPSRVPYADDIVMVLFAALTYSGSEVARPFFAPPHQSPPGIQSVFQASETNKESFLIPPVRRVLDLSPPPRFRSSVMGLLSEFDILDRFLKPLLLLRESPSEPLILVIALVVTFYLQVLTKVPDIPYGRVISGLEGVNRPRSGIQKALRFEIVKISSDFLENCLAFLDWRDISGAVSPLFDWSLLRRLARNAQIAPLGGSNVVPGDGAGRDRLFEMIVVYCCRALPSVSALDGGLLGFSRV